MRMPVTVVPTAVRSSRTIGAILLDTGLLSVDDIDRVLALQRQQKTVRFGEAAIRIGVVSEADVQFALSRQFEYAYLRSSTDTTVLSEDLIAAYEPFSTRADDFRAIRSHLLLHWFNKTQQRKVLTIMAAQSGDGCTFTAANLAIVFSQLGERTLLIDGNLRNPRVHQLFNLQNKLGLSTILAGNQREDVIIRITDLAGLFVLPSGPVPPNPLELLGRKTFEHLLLMARNNFDCVIIDTPGLSYGEDALMIAAHAGATIAVGRVASTRVEPFTDMIKGLLGAGVTVVGSILNEVPVAKAKKPKLNSLNSSEA